jgi:hypothetical protein
VFWLPFEFVMVRLALRVSVPVIVLPTRVPTKEKPRAPDGVRAVMVTLASVPDTLPETSTVLGTTVQLEPLALSVTVDVPLAVPPSVPLLLVILAEKVPLWNKVKVQISPLADPICADGMLAPVKVSGARSKVAVTT